MPSKNVVKHKFLPLNRRFDRILERDQIKCARTNVHVKVIIIFGVQRFYLRKSALKNLVIATKR